MNTPKPMAWMRGGRISGILVLCAAGAMIASSARATGPSRQAILQWPQAPGGGGAGGGGGGGDPFAPIAERMGQVVADLDGKQTDAPVQTKEKKVVSDLDEIIAELQKQCSGTGGGNPNPTKPMGKSTLAKGPGGSGPMHDAKEGTKLWGQLPPKMREQILQSQTEGFPPGYEAVLASYYARLAQSQVAPEAAEPTAGATTKPSAP